MVDFNIQHNPDRNRFEAISGEDLLGRVDYEDRGEVVVLTHTVVEPAAEGKGVGSALARTALEHAREEGRTVDPQCPFIAAWIDRHPDYADLVAPSA